MTSTMPPLLDSVVGGRMPERCLYNAYGSKFAKALKGIGGDPKSVKKLRSGHLLIETVSALQSKSFLLAKTFIDSTLNVTPHKSLNSCRGVISEPDILCASEAEILKGLSDQGVTQSHNYAQAAKSSTINNSTQTDENITKIKCPTLKLLQPLSSLPKPNTSKSTPAVSTSSSSTEAQLLPSASSIAATVSQPQQLTPVSDAVLSATNYMFTPIFINNIRFPIHLRC
ncbi:uncharacterized protein TNCV_955831 [Trichonephila clavipes]|nr:uncharacterized protein TNCV_955831 [Trichonephila clavipes]